MANCRHIILESGRLGIRRNVTLLPLTLNWLSIGRTALTSFSSYSHVGCQNMPQKANVSQSGDHSRSNRNSVVFAMRVTGNSPASSALIPEASDMGNPRLFKPVWTVLLPGCRHVQTSLQPACKSKVTWRSLPCTEVKTRSHRTLCYPFRFQGRRHNSDGAERPTPIGRSRLCCDFVRVPVDAAPRTLRERLNAGIESTYSQSSRRGSFLGWVAVIVA